MIAFGMKTTLVHFNDKYCNDKGVEDEAAEIEEEDNNGLEFGAYEVAFCADLRATFVYKICERMIDKLNYAGSYQDNRLAIFQGHHTI
eukprot:13414064-Ditylum_brightwellii.AAC.1